ncbi:MAG: RNA-binding protein [Acidobacteriota bacterium]|nr:MAG: RNA-binding protein [Acidobacteriota bacterium]
MATRLFVGNLPRNVTEMELREHFSTVGPLSYISVPTDRETGAQRGFAFLEFKDQIHAGEAIRRFDNTLFKGSSISVKEARPKADRMQSGTSISRPDPIADPGTADPPDSKPSPNFGPDASPRRNRGKMKARLNSERGPKGPMREVIRGQFFGEPDDIDDDVETSEEEMAERDNLAINNKYRNDQDGEKK